MLSATFLGGEELMGDIFNTTKEYLTIAGATTAATVFTGKGTLLRVVVEKSLAGAELTFADISGNDLLLNPDCTVKGTLPYGLDFDKGCVVSASSGAGGLVQILYRHEDA